MSLSVDISFGFTDPCLSIENQQAPHDEWEAHCAC